MWWNKYHLHIQISIKVSDIKSPNVKYSKVLQCPRSEYKLLCDSHSSSVFARRCLLPDFCRNEPSHIFAVYLQGKRRSFKNKSMERLHKNAERLVSWVPKTKIKKSSPSLRNPFKMTWDIFSTLWMTYKLKKEFIQDARTLNITIGVGIIRCFRFL